MTERKEKTALFGIKLLGGQVLYQAARHQHDTLSLTDSDRATVSKPMHNASKTCGNGY